MFDVTQTGVILPGGGRRQRVVDGGYGTNDGQNGPGDEIPVLADGERKDRLDVGGVSHRLAAWSSWVTFILFDEQLTTLPFKRQTPFAEGQENDRLRSRPLSGGGVWRRRDCRVPPVEERRARAVAILPKPPCFVRGRVSGHGLERGPCLQPSCYLATCEYVAL